MKSFEYCLLCCSPFLPPLYGLVRGRLREIVRSRPAPVEILDVGGRKSPYTVGVPAQVTISELPRDSDVQKELRLGINDQIVRQTLARRSNIRSIVYDDMTKSTLPPASFDVVVAVEVLEHVEEDEQFLRQVHRVLRPGGVFLMTTPNGRYVPNANPDHKRHYTPEHLQRVLSTAFGEVQVEEAIANSVYGGWGLYGWSVRKPWQTMRSMFGNWMNRRLSRPHVLRSNPAGSCHLLATAAKGIPVRQSDEAVEGLAPQMLAASLYGAQATLSTPEIAVPRQSQ